MTIKVWHSAVRRLLFGTIDSFSNGGLKVDLPICGNDNYLRYIETTYLEYVGRMLCGLSPILESSIDSLNINISSLHQGLSNITNLQHPDFIKADNGSHRLVDAAFLALAFVRSPQVLWGSMAEPTKRKIIDMFVKTK